ncbi:hypothetical protein [Microvirga massiliensis]|uniref:hypothetical protein n=1 Tax=Microvirga massiliensis TaxID=1033741 RepID=UPI00062B9822|nr:hypothetical protein [Microvirga massiliensis]
MKGVEPERIEVARFRNTTYIFVGLERASLIAVYRNRGSGKAPEFRPLAKRGEFRRQSAACDG